MSNGRRLFVVGDGKTEWARRYRDIYEAHISDAGGADLLSEAQLQLCRRAASLAIEAERMEGELSEGKPVDIDVLGRLTGHLGRTYDRLGLKRVARDLRPDDPEAARRVTMAELRMRGDALALAQDLAALASPEA